ncbi:MAG: ATP-binding cassette domain-containing protein [Planctomycetes bacterium]|nr:ATP-binding cassette domain-containing protein [Planctomycetota bacterium]
MDAAVRLTDVTKTFGTQRAVDTLSLTVPQGSIYGFIGPNGSGKTTTLRMILHIIHPDSGTLEVLGERDTRAANDRVGYLPEERGLYKKMTVRQLLAYYGALKGLSSRTARSEGEAWLERLGLGEAAGRKVETLSKGMAQKLQFISTVIARPELLILDEPFSGLDPVNLEALRTAILELNRDGTTVIFSTHDMEMAERMCDFVFMIFRGQKVLDGTLEAIQHEYGADTVRLRADASAREILARHPAVAKVTDMGNYQEVRLDGDPQRLLADLAGSCRVTLFEIAQPSLHDIFVRIAGPEAAKAASGAVVAEAVR